MSNDTMADATQLLHAAPRTVREMSACLEVKTDTAMGYVRLLEARGLVKAIGTKRESKHGSPSVLFGWCFGEAK